MIGRGGLPSLVVDNSIAVKWYLPEEYSEESLNLFHAGWDDRALLSAADLIHAEFGNALWSNHRQGELTLEEALDYYSDFVGAPALYTYKTAPLVPAAIEMAPNAGSRSTTRSTSR